MYIYIYIHILKNTYIYREREYIYVYYNLAIIWYAGANLFGMFDFFKCPSTVKY